MRNFTGESTDTVYGERESFIFYLVHLFKLLSRYTKTQTHEGYNGDTGKMIKGEEKGEEKTVASSSCIILVILESTDWMTG